MIKDCEWYLDDFCCKDLDSARVWDCTCKNKKERIKIWKKTEGYNCPYPRLGKDK